MKFKCFFNVLFFLPGVPSKPGSAAVKILERKVFFKDRKLEKLNVFSFDDLMLYLLLCGASNKFLLSISML